MLAIAPGSRPMTAINVFSVAPEHQALVLDLLTQATERHIRHVPGFVGAALHRGLDGTQVTMYAQWATPEDYDRMRARPDASAWLADALAFARFSPGFYEVSAVFEPATASDIVERRFYHGTRADLKPGDLIQPGFSSNYTDRRSPWVYFTETLHAATWGAELARGDGPPRLYVVEPIGSFVDDPNLTDKKFPGNPTKSFRSSAPVRVVDEVRGWQGHSPEEIRAMKDGLVGKEPIDD
jgi:rifampin ADP-ribosylating transferase